MVVPDARRRSQTPVTCESVLMTPDQQTALHHEREKHRFFSNTLMNGGAQIAAVLSSLVFMPLLIESFKIEYYGLFMIVSSVTAYAALLDFGVGSALTKMVAEHRSTGDRESLSGVVSSALAFYLVVGVVVAAVVTALALLVGVFFDVGVEGPALLRDMLLVSAAFQLIQWPASTARHVLAGLQRYDILSKNAVLATVLMIGVTLAVILTGAGPVALVAASGGVASIIALLNVYLARRLSDFRVSFALVSRSRLTIIFGFSWAIFVVQLSDLLFYQQTDRLLVGALISATAVGLYEAAAKFNVLVIYVSGLTISAVLPLAASMKAQGRHASLRSLFVRGTKYGVALVAPIALVAAVLATPLIRVWLGPQFTEMGIVAAWLLVPHSLLALGLMGDSIVISHGRIGRRIPYITGQAVLNIVLSVLLIRPFGILGVAMGTAIAHLVDVPLHIRFLLKETGVSLREWLREIVSPVYPLLVAPVLVSVLLRGTILAESIPGLIVAGAISVGIYWVAVFFLGTSDPERRDLLQAVSALRERALPPK